MDEALGWLLWIGSTRVRTIELARACGERWETLLKKYRWTGPKESHCITKV